MQLPLPRLTRLGIPDRFVEHGDTHELHADLGLDAEGIARTCLQLAQDCGTASNRMAQPTG